MKSWHKHLMFCYCVSLGRVYLQLIIESGPSDVEVKLTNAILLYKPNNPITTEQCR